LIKTIDFLFENIFLLTKERFPWIMRNQLIINKLNNIPNDRFDGPSFNVLFMAGHFMEVVFG